jgi:hypothetical protein
MLYAITTARRLNWWRPIMVTLPLGLAVEVTAVIVIHLNTPLHVGYFGVISAAFAVLWGLVALVYGIRRGPRIADST